MRWFDVFVALAIVPIALGCQAGGGGASNKMSSGSGSGASGGTIDSGGTGPDISIGGLGGIGGTGQTFEGSIESDPGAEITVSGEPSSVTFTVHAPDGAPVNGATWSVDDTRIGSIGEDGVFHANGYVGGVVTITATVGSGTISTQLTVTVDITENPGGLATADQDALTGGGTADSGFRWLYPYDRTVFPRGLPSPSMQFGGTAASATYLKVTAPYFSYQQFAAGSTPTRVTMPEPVWRGVTLTAQAADEVTVAVTKQSGGAVTGPATVNWKIAQASLKGIVYYSTYKSPLTQDGAVMSVRPGQTAQVVQGGCTVCHTVSANGNVLASGVGYWADGVTSGDPETFNPTNSATFNISPDGTIATRIQLPEGRSFAFAALSPDGSRALTSGVPAGRWPPQISRGVYSGAGFPSLLLDTATGQPIAAPSLSALVTYAQTPAFSPDGARLAFVNADRLDQRVLSVMDFDAAAATFSNLQDVVTEPTKAVSWPTFLPDGRGVIYHEGDSFDSSLFVEPATAPSGAQFAELRLVDSVDKTTKTLDAVNGRANGSVYLPYGAGAEGQMNYEPSVLPVALGGYYWVLFTSRRAYGNTIAPGGTLARGDNPWGTEAEPSPRKKIWIAAIDVDHVSAPDPSHPAFYLPGQELEAGNMRAFAALAPCKADGASCESGADCCGGFCRETGRSSDGVPTLACVPPPDNACSNAEEACVTAADCCNPLHLCINARCALQSPPH